MNTTLKEQLALPTDRSILLGRLMWYAVTTDTLIDHKTIVQELHRVGLTSAIPPYPKDHNVFRRITTTVQRRKEPTTTEGVFENWLVRDVATRGEMTIVRRVVVETVDKAGRRLDYRQVADIMFDRGTSTLTYAWINGFDDTTDPVAGQMISEVTKQYKTWRGKLNHYAIREWIRKTIIDMGAIAVRPSGGVYFLREDHADNVEALESFVAALPGSNECHSLPLVDDKKQRQMLHRALEAETSDAIDGLITEIRTIRKDGKVTPKRFAEILGESKRLRSKTAEYAKLLETSLGEIDSRIDILQKSTMGIAGLQKKSRKKIAASTSDD